ncbi:sulfatase [Streptomyces sporangiiformans]|uniref:Sulfatase n=1 Tax=Streptomyces sporangiiformans TaxID=2315329 RepID=A0A505DRK0_9ACTN|nr:sulfatase [Streptomyces sporangiiformans]
MSSTTNSPHLPDTEQATPEEDVTPKTPPADTPDDTARDSAAEEAAASDDHTAAAEATAEEAEASTAGEPETGTAEKAEPANADEAEPVAAEEVEPATADEAEPDAKRADASASDAPAGEAPDQPVAARRRWRDRHAVAARNVGWVVTVLALALVCVALLMPTRIDRFSPGVFLRIPVEAVLGAGVLIALPRKPRLVAAVLAGVGLGLLTVLNLLDIGFYMFLGRGFNVVLDWVLFDDAKSYLEDSMGRGGTIGALIGVVALILAVLALMTLAVLRLGNVMARNRDRATRATVAIGTVWVTCAALGLQLTGPPLAARSTVALVQDRMDRVRATLKDEAAFAKEAKKDAFGNTPGDQLLTGLRGKDVIFTFIESYGRSAVEDPDIAPGVDATLTAKNKELREAGFAAKSGWLTSATYGGSSWLGHSTFLSGLWINNQNRYRTVTAGEHLTVTGAFKRTGAWRTVGIMPGIQKNWPEGKFYGLDHVYDSRELGYRGPKFSWSTMPDQYALKAFERLEHGKKHDKPLMSEIVLTSSHQPWAPIPKTIPDDQVGDGSVYKDIAKAGKDPADVFYDSDKAKEEYGKSIQYSVTSLIDYLVKHGKKNTVLVFLGDHQPMAKVSGNNASRDVPISIVARDKSVLDKIDDWNWTDGLEPDPKAPVWRMDSFRDRFLTAYGSQPNPSK